jgi:hypothetical protein
LGSKLYGLYPILLEQVKNLFIKGIGSGGDANGIDQAGSEEGLNLFQITDLLFSMNRCETSTVETNLFLSLLFVGRKSDERGFNEPSNRKGGWEFFTRDLLVAEETALTTAQIRKKNGND